MKYDYSIEQYSTAQYSTVPTYVCYLAVEVVVVLEPDGAGRLAGVHLAGESLLGAAAVHAQHRPANIFFFRQKIWF